MLASLRRAAMASSRLHPVPERRDAKLLRSQTTMSIGGDRNQGWRASSAGVVRLSRVALGVLRLHKVRRGLTAITGPLTLSVKHRPGSEIREFEAAARVVEIRIQIEVNQS
jgi:hypothetical protein